MQYRNRGHNLGNDGARLLGRRGHRHTTSTPLDQLHYGIALVWIQAAELILHVDTGLAAEINKIFALQIEFFRQGINADSLLQMELLYSQSRAP
jgi:hypothetical protein